MSGFIDWAAARATGGHIGDRPRLHLRRRTRFEPQAIAPQTIPAVQSSTPVAADQPTPSAVASPPTARAPDSADRPPPMVSAPTDPAPPYPVDQPATAVPEPVVVVQERVVPLLVQSGVLNASDEVQVVDDAVAGPPGSAVQLRVADAYPAHPGREQRPGAPLPRPAAAPDIHVHIGRIDVIRPTPPQPPQPPREQPARPPAQQPPRRRIPAVDHAEYLAGRRERR